MADLIVVGNPAAGKGEVCEYLAKEYGFTHIVASDLIKAYAQENDLPYTRREDLGSAHALMR